MRICSLFLMVFCSYYAYAQVNDNFDDGNLSTNPAWQGSNAAADFTVTTSRLRSNSTTANSSFYLTTPSTLTNNCEWQFWCNLQFATSGSNYVDIYLTADERDLNVTSINGYFVRIGNSDDDICLYKRSGHKSTIVKLIDGVDGSIGSGSNNTVRIKVTRIANVFKLERDLGGTNTAYFSEGSAADNDTHASVSFGIQIQQSSSSFFQKHFFDDIKVAALIADNIPPRLISARVTDTLGIELTFDEPVDSLSAKAITNYSLSPNYGNPARVVALTDRSKYRLQFSTALETGSYEITATHIYDLSGNLITGNNTIHFTYLKPYRPKPGDLVINEILADPSPQIDLPGVEFIELWNRSAHTILLKNWKYGDSGATATFGADSIAAGELLILCAKPDTAEFKKYGRVAGIAPWISLTNSGKQLTLKDDAGVLIDQVNYSDTWYHDNLKKAGGWSLELVNPTSICRGAQNWGASVNIEGGTPGRQNSLFQTASTEKLKLTGSVLADTTTLVITFNRAVDSLVASQLRNYSVDMGVGNPLSATPLSPYFTSVSLKLPPLTRGNTFTLTLKDLTDCSGSQIDGASATIALTLPQQPARNDIVINELLFNPYPGGADFFEIYNRSATAFDLQELAVATLNTKDSLVSIKPLATAHRFIKPGEFLAFSTDPGQLKAVYHVPDTAALVKLQSLPGFSDDSGTIILLNGTRRIDQLNYSEKMHFPLIKNTEGVSLERSRYEIPANEPGNFRSAAGSAGYATPGYQNSQFISAFSAPEELSLVSATCSPDNDGFEDVLEASYNFLEPGMVANTRIFSANGALALQLNRNLTLAQHGTIVWNGLNKYNERMPTGIYILYLEVFDLNGRVKKYKKSFALVEKLE